MISQIKARSSASSNSAAHLGIIEGFVGGGGVKGSVWWRASVMTSALWNPLLLWGKVSPLCGDILELPNRRHMLPVLECEP